MLTLAVDPGKNGALVWMHYDQRSKEPLQRARCIRIEDMPLKQVRGKYNIDGAKMRTWIAQTTPDLMVIEGTNSRPGEGHKGAYSFGYSCGVVYGVGLGFGIPVVRVVDASSWTRYAGAPSTKDARRIVAKKKWPEFSEFFSLKKDHDRADAALLGEWAAKNLRISTRQ